MIRRIKKYFASITYGFGPIRLRSVSWRGYHLRLKLLVFSSLTLLLFSSLYNQNCSSSGSIDFTSVGGKTVTVGASQGGGDGFDGKPSPGNYIRNYPGYQCSGTNTLQSTMTVDTTNTIATIITDNCTSPNYVAPTTAPQFDISSYNLDYLIYGRAIYQKVAAFVTPAQPDIAEVLCQYRDRTVGFDVLIHLSSDQKVEMGRIYLGKYNNGLVSAFKSADFSIVKSALPGQTRFISTNYKLDLRVNDESIDGISFAGSLVSSIDNTDYNVAVGCRRMSVKPVLDTTPFITAIGVGKYHTCAIVKGGVQCFGSNSNLQLGQPRAVSTSTVPVKVAGLGSGVTALSIGYNNNCAIQNGNVKCWGANNYLQAGVNNGGADVQAPTTITDINGNPLVNVSQVYAGMTHACAVAGGAAYCWGSNGSGQLGYIEDSPLKFQVYIGGSAQARPVLDMGAGVSAVATGLSHTCGIINGGMKCWGANDERGGFNDVCYRGSQMLEADPPDGSYKVCWPYITEDGVYPITSTPDPIYGFYSSCGPVTVNMRANRCNPRPIQSTSFPAGTGLQQIAAISSTMCALAADGTVKCWGGYNWGALGQGPSYPGDKPANTAVQVLNMSNATMLGALSNGFCAISGGDLYCWGFIYSENQLGVPNPSLSNSYPLPTKVAGLPAGAVSYFAGGSVDETHHGCAVAQGQAYCWGGNTFGELGDGTTVNRTVPPFNMVTTWQ